MSAVLAPLAPPAPPTVGGRRPLLWTVEEFHRVGSTNIWRGRRPRLIRGVILEEGPMNPPHAKGVGLANDAIRSAFGGDWWVRVQLPLVFGLRTDPQPDMSVVRGGPRDYDDHPFAASLVVEVSDTSLTDDTTTVAELYAEAGVPDYWIVDVVGRRLLVLRDPAPVAAGGHAFRTQLSLGPADTVSPLAAPAAMVAVADLLP